MRGVGAPGDPGGRKITTIKGTPSTTRFRRVLWLLGLIVGGGIGLALSLNFRHIVEQDSWFYRNPSVTALGGVGMGLLLASAMYQFRRHHSLTWGYFVLLVGAMANAERQSRQRRDRQIHSRRSRAVNFGRFPADLWSTPI